MKKPQHQVTNRMKKPRRSWQKPVLKKLDVERETQFGLAAMTDAFNNQS